MVLAPLPHRRPGPSVAHFRLCRTLLITIIQHREKSHTHTSSECLVSQRASVTPFSLPPDVIEVTLVRNAFECLGLLHSDGYHSHMCLLSTFLHWYEIRFTTLRPSRLTFHSTCRRSRPLQMYRRTLHRSMARSTPVLPLQEPFPEMAT